MIEFNDKDVYINVMFGDVNFCVLLILLLCFNLFFVGFLFYYGIIF